VGIEFGLEPEKMNSQLECNPSRRRSSKDSDNCIEAERDSREERFHRHIEWWLTELEHPICLVLGVLYTAAH
jgi:hypothetical protein